MASFTGLKDMFDGGGAGKSGAKFEGGGILSAAANAVARPAGSRDRGEPDMRTGVGGFARDMVNGGGFGAAGDTFRGGPYGGLFGGILNAVGVRPMGYADRMADSQSALNGAMAGVAAYRPPVAPVMPTAAPVAPTAAIAPVVTSNLSDIEALNADMIRMGILPNPANRVMDSGPRQYFAGGNVAPMFFNNTPAYLRGM